MNRGAWGQHRWLAATLALVMLTGCQPKPEPAADRPYPRITDIMPAPNRGPAQPVDHPNPTAAAEPTEPKPTSEPPSAGNLEAFVRRYDVPLAASLDEAWTLVSDDRLSPTMVDHWAANGLRVGELPADQLAAFERALGTVEHISDLRMLGVQHLGPLKTASPVFSPIRLVLQEHDPARQEVLHLDRGQLQFLLRVTQSEQGDISVELIPHHHHVQGSVLVRTPEQRALDGRIFSELTFSHIALPDRLLVISMMPPPEPVDPVLTIEPKTPAEGTATDGGTEDGAADAASPAAGEANEPAPTVDPTQPGNLDAAANADRRINPTAESVMARLEDHLGRHLLTARFMGRPVQMVLLLWVHQEKPPASVAQQTQP